MTEKFFILGCQRSGTTLMRLILDSHPDITCLDEYNSYRIGLGEEPAPDARLVGLKVPVWTQHFPDQYYNGEKIIFMLRPVEDVVASMLDLKLGGYDWVETWLKPAIGNKLAIPAFRERYTREIELMGDNVAAQGALFWKEKTETLKRLPDAYPVEYNRLVSAPTTTLRGVCDYLGVEWSPLLLKHHQIEHPGTFPDGTTVGATEVARPISKSSIGHGKNLSEEDLALIRAIVEIGE